jgi:CRP-like cAMP-binding protein
MDRYAFFRQFHNLSKPDYELLTDNLQVKTYRKGDVLLRPGEIQKELYLVKTGVQMSYFESEEKVHVMAFTYAPGICAVPGSFSFQQPSDSYLSCISDSELECLPYPHMESLFERSQSIERLFRRMTEAILSGMITRHIELHTMSIEERFRVFCKRSPHLLQLVPHKYIASYLGIDPSNFSKLFNSVKI